MSTILIKQLWGTRGRILQVSRSIVGLYFSAAVVYLIIWPNIDQRPTSEVNY